MDARRSEQNGANIRKAGLIDRPTEAAQFIVGDGIAGMTLAIALKRAGIRSEVVEINPQWTVGGLGIAFGGRALRALRQVGVLDQCVAKGFGY